MLRSNASLRAWIYLLLIAPLVLGTSISADAATGSIRGLVCDQETGKPLVYANVVVLGTTYGASVGKSGEFRIDHIPAGRHRVQSSYVGYEPVTLEVVVRAGEVTDVSFCRSADDTPIPETPITVVGPIPDPRTGELWVIGKNKSRLPLRKTMVSVSVSGSIAKVSVEQTFENSSVQSIEAVYVFPLPHGAAVHAMSMRIGERQLDAQIRKRQEAKEVYEEARQQGRTAALLEQERPNIFTQHVANIMPGNDVVVRIEYAEQLEYDDGRYELVVPTVVGPRFIPGAPSAEVVVASATNPTHAKGTQGSPSHDGTGWSSNTDRVPDASRITPPCLGPGEDSGHRLQIRVELDAGIPLADVRSINHSVKLERPDAGQAIISTRPSDTIPNKDFVLRYSTRSGSSDAGILSHHAKGEEYGYFTLLMEPPEPPNVEIVPPRELLLVLDVSGSMNGAPIATMKGVVRWILRRLESQDSFNIVTFSNTAKAYSPGSLVASGESVQKALRYTELLRGQGGTHMREGLSEAFALPAEGGHRRTICLLTDGLIGNDAELIQLVRSQIGNDRLFAMGIGSSPNRFLVDGLAEEGVGAQDFVSLDEDPREAVDRFFRRIDSPVLSGLEIDWGSLQVEDMQPPQLPDLYRGQVLRVTGRYRTAGEDLVVIRGMRGQETFEKSLRVELPQQAESHAGLRHLWARTRIHELARLQRAGDETAAPEIESVGLQFAMMTDYTAFVVTDNQIVNDSGVPHLVPQPVEMPQGIRHEMIFGSASSGMSKGVAGKVQTITVTGDPKKVDVKSGNVSHVSKELNLPPSLPVEGVEEAKELNSGLVTQGGELHVRAGRSAAGQVRIDEQNRLRATIDLVEATLNRGKTIQLRIRLANETGQKILLPDEYQLHDGTLLVQVRYGEEVVPAPQIAVSEVNFEHVMQPGEEREYLVTLNRPDGFDFERRGRYEIVIMKLVGVWLPNNQRIHYVNVR